MKQKTYHLVQLIKFETEFDTDERTEEIKDRLYEVKFSELTAGANWLKYWADERREMVCYDFDEMRRKIIGWANDRPHMQTLIIEEENDDITAIFMRNKGLINDLVPASKRSRNDIMNEFEITKDHNSFFRTENEIWLDKLDDLCKIAPALLKREISSINRIQDVLDTWDSDQEKIDALKKMRLSNTDDHNLRDMYKAFKEGKSGEFEQAKNKMVEAVMEIKRDNLNPI